MPPPTSAETARYLPFRRLVWALYFGFAGLFSLLVIVGVVSSTLKMMPPAPPTAPQALSFHTCVARAQADFLALDAQRQELSRVGTALHAEVSWSEFRLRWLTRLRSEEASCKLDDPSRTELKALFQRLEHVENLYTTAATQYAGEIGPSVDLLRQDLQRLAAASP